MNSKFKKIEKRFRSESNLTHMDASLHLPWISLQQQKAKAISQIPKTKQRIRKVDHTKQ